MKTYVPIADMKYYIGIDPGLKGGISILDQNRNIVMKCVMPIIGKASKDIDKIKLIETLRLFEGRDAFCILEKQHPRKLNGPKQAFKLGYGFACLEMLLAVFKIPYEIIAPNKWQKSILKGLNTDDTKLASILYCQRKYPNEDWRATERCTTNHDGLTDATCMAEYGLNKQIGK